MTVEEGTVPEAPVFTPGDLPPAPSLLGAKRTLVGSPKAATRTRLYREAMGKIRAERVIAVDVETTGLKHWLGDRVVGIAVYCPNINESFYFPFRHGHGEATNLSEGSGREKVEGGALIRRDFGPLLARADQAKINFNCKFDQEALYQDTGVLWGGKVWDAQLSAHLLNENEPPGEGGLKALADRYLGAGASQAERNLGSYLAMRGIPDKGGLWYLDPEEVTDYACADVELAYALLIFHRPWLDKYALRQIFEEQCEYAQVVAEMECHGVLIDVGVVEERLTEAEAKYDELLGQLTAQLGLAPGEFNPNSPVQCARAFGLVDGKGKPSTAKGIIAAAIARGNWPLEPQGRLLMQTKAWDKAAGLYYRKYLQLMEARPYDQLYDPDTDRVRLRHLLHCQYRMTGTVAGRLSCVEPNLQAVPRQSEIYRVKDAFVPRPGHWLVEIDYSQAELRQLAHEADIPAMYAVLNGDGGDLHTSTAQELTRIRGGREVPRDVSKRMNFGVVYGLGAPGLAEAMMITEAEAEPFVEAYHQLYPRIRQYSAELQAQARQGSIRLWTGRMRHYNAPRCDCGQRGCMEWHKAMSNKIQGGVGEMLRVTMLDIRSRFYARGVRMVLQIHDSLVLEVPKRSFPDDMVLILEILEAMERGPDDRFANHFWRCPPRGDVKYSESSWSTAQTFERKEAELWRAGLPIPLPVYRPPEPERDGFPGTPHSNNLDEPVRRVL